MQPIVKCFALVMAVTGFVACGDKDEESEARAATQDCPAPPAEIAATNLPAHFPELDGVHYTASAPQGPSTRVLGYANNSLSGLFEDLKEKFGEEPYAIDKTEKDKHDAEVNFSSETDQVTGQVAIGEDCKGRLSVRVVVRPR